jgi:hypothetical protein
MKTCTNGPAIRFGSGLALALTMCLASGCGDTIKLPTADSTPPTYKWHVIVKNSTDQYEYDTSGQTIHLGKRYQYYVSFVVYDLDGGVMHIARSGGGFTACSGSSRDDFELPPIKESNVLHPDADGSVKTTAVLASWVDATCKHQTGGFYPQVVLGPGGSIQFSGEGENYFGGKVTSTLTIVSDP